MVVIKNIKDVNNNVMYPITDESAVRCHNSTLKDVIDSVTRLYIHNLNSTNEVVDLEPYSVYIWDRKSTPNSLTLNFPTIEANGINKMKEIMVEFYVPSVDFSLTTMDNVSWSGDEIPEFEEGLTYQIHFTPRLVDEEGNVIWMAQVSSGFYIDYSGSIAP